MLRRPPPGQQALHAVFLRALARHGNERQAARTAGVARSTLQGRRDADPAFAARWRKALARAATRLAAEAVVAQARQDNDEGGAGGRTMTVRLASGRVLRRRRPPRTFTREREQAFLLALSACANVRLAAAAAGVTAPTIYQRRLTSPAFAREMRLALARGYDEVEAALLSAGLEGADTMGDWRRNDPPAIPPMTANQALQLLYLHQKEARLGGTPERLRRRRGEPEAAWHERLALMGEHRLARDREAHRIAQAARRVAGEPACPPGPAPVLPDLSQVTGWSSADPAVTPRDPDRALFGGFRATHLTEEQVAKGHARRRGR